MKYIDFKIQTVLLIAAVVLFALFSGYGLMIGQFFVGVWQMLSCVISVIVFRTFRRQKLLHLGLSIAVLTALYFLKSDPAFTNDLLNLLVFFLPCWALAIYYYIISWRWYQGDSARSKFLPNISF